MRGGLAVTPRERDKQVSGLRGSWAVTSKRRDKRVSSLVNELERRVDALDETVQAEVSSYISYHLLSTKLILQRQESASIAPYYTEKELMEAYQDVLVVPVPQSQLPNKAELEAIQRAEAEEDQRILVSLKDRLYDPSADIQSRPTPTPQSNLHRILLRAHEILSRVEGARKLALNTDSTNNNTRNFLPISILSIRECQALVRACVSFIILCYIYYGADERRS